MLFSIQTEKKTMFICQTLLYLFTLKSEKNINVTKTGIKLGYCYAFKKIRTSKLENLPLKFAG